MEFKCDKCSKVFYKKASLGSHKSHCGKNRKNYKFSINDVLKGHETRKRNKKVGIKVKGHKCSSETKEKLRQKRFEYLEKKLGQTAWERRNQGKMSYLEQWFYDECILKNSLQDKYDIVNEYPIYPYFIDFAFLNIKLCVELDGQCHFINNKRIEHDNTKNKKLTDINWKVYRISGKPNMITVIDFLNYLDGFSPDTKLLEEKVYKGRIRKIISKRSRQQYYKDIKNDYQNKQNQYINLVINSNIDFSKFGWVGKVSEIINQKPQKVSGWFKKIMPEFYKEKCFKRKRKKCQK